LRQENKKRPGKPKNYNEPRFNHDDTGDTTHPRKVRAGKIRYTK
jgi:hypothetical protein